ncbi:bifunctional 2-polyprenyl-6-hydroxyphenol methylase/3-demethylubiquinol 3-O-methyltransferase UbiG [Thermodesulfovibrio sp. Kuro-1]|uniref:class I SAM-dependent methyltransferase n=1 Tax=Thermodesulfovibrio sp. Kuro-1 TaxID=2580394 RepID=UPI001144C331|nr:class I SAM-dependent methyltransferase [Thermodesulfovibrio sp. Kuro-1]
MTVLKDYKIIDGIKVFDSEIPENHPDFDASTLDEIFEREEKHFWFITRRKIILRVMRNFIDTEQRIIEVGAGTGNISKYLFENGYKNICVGDIHMKGLKYAKKYGISECYQFDLLQSPFENEFDAICMFDVLEHLSDEDLALKNIYKMLNYNGKVILTVPAHMWLWNRMDDILGHKRRYTKTQIILR